MKTLIPFLLSSLFFINVYSQVGVNTETPEQILDVNGKVKIADDVLTPTDGTMRFNLGNDDFEGYTGGQWKSLTRSSNIPSNGQFLTSRVGAEDDNDPVLMQFIDAAGNTVISNTVPMGKYFLITHINIAVLSVSEINLGLFPIYRLRFDFGDDNSDYDIFGRYFGGPIFNVSAGFSPLAIVSSGEDIQVTNFAAPQGLDGIGGVFVYVAGFLVDDLSFD